MLQPTQQRLLLDIARAAIREAVQGRRALPPDKVDPALLQPAGSFVSLHALGSHRLRGCVGRLDATDSLLSSVMSAGVNVLDDPRFADDRVTLEELPYLEIEISVLSPLRPAPSPLDFDPANDGIYLTVGHRAGCFLPQVARETGWTRERLLERLCVEKMGLPGAAWRAPNAKLQVFTTLIIGPEPFDPGESTS